MAVGVRYSDNRLPLTVYYDLFLKALRARPDYTETPGPLDFAFPAEDVVIETNWPRYDQNRTALLRGAFDDAVYTDYLKTLFASPSRLCVINMQPYTGLLPHMVDNPNLILADGCLTQADRANAPRTISMPALPLAVGPLGGGPLGGRPLGGRQFDPAAKTRIASFRGAATHPIRAALTAFNALPGYCCEIVGTTGYIGKIDATLGKVDQDYADLLNESTFAIVPRGDSHFSYRLLEVMSFGCIPIILSDGWILPFDRTIPWRELSLHIPEAAFDRIPALLARLSPATIENLQGKVIAAYQNHLANFDVIIDTLLGEAAMIWEA